MASIFGELYLPSTFQKSGRYCRPRPASLSTQSFLSHSVAADATQCGGLALRFPGGLGGRKADLGAGSSKETWAWFEQMHDSVRESLSFQVMLPRGPLSVWNFAHRWMLDCGVLIPTP